MVVAEVEAASTHPVLGNIGRGSSTSPVSERGSSADAPERNLGRSLPERDRATHRTASANADLEAEDAAEGKTLTIAVLIEVPLFRESVTKAPADIAGFRAYDVDPTFARDRLTELAPQIALVDASSAEVAALVRAVAEAVPDLRIVAVAMPESEQQLFVQLTTRGSAFPSCASTRRICALRVQGVTRRNSECAWARWGYSTVRP